MSVPQTFGLPLPQRGDSCGGSEGPFHDLGGQRWLLHGDQGGGLVHVRLNPVSALHLHASLFYISSEKGLESTVPLLSLHFECV